MFIKYVVLQKRFTLGQCNQAEQAETNATRKRTKFGSINVRTATEKSESSKIYMITKEVARAGLAFCCLQEVRYRNTRKQRIRLDTGVEYDFLWCGIKKRRNAGVGILIKIDATITAADPDIWIQTYGSTDYGN